MLRTCDECGYTTNTEITLCPSSTQGADCMGTLWPLAPEDLENQVQISKEIIDEIIREEQES